MLKSLRLLSVFLFTAIATTMLMQMAYAAEAVNPALQSFLEFLGPVLGDVAAKFPVVGKVLIVMLWARLILKPIMSALVTMGEEIPDGKVREFLRSMSHHKAYKVVAYILDWFGSVKLPKSN